VLGIIEKCTKTEKQLYDEISQEEDVNNDGDSGDDEF
jgi:hypothetical protein